MSIKLGSLFDGIGGFPYSGIKFGITPAWASEIEPWPIKVTEKHFPNMKHLGDITQIDGAEIEPVDIICGGFPCQDVSVAGKREGLAGERSGLFFEAIRVIREMQEATNYEYPKAVVIENVPGLLSSNKGEDMRVVLDELQNLGFIVDPNILDAQYMGVPQRRRRVFIVCVSLRNLLQMKTSLSKTMSIECAVQILLNTWSVIQAAYQAEHLLLDLGGATAKSVISLQKKMNLLNKTLGSAPLRKLLMHSVEVRVLSETGELSFSDAILDSLKQNQWLIQADILLSPLNSQIDEVVNGLESIYKTLNLNWDGNFTQEKLSTTLTLINEITTQQIYMFMEALLNICEHIKGLMRLSNHYWKAASLSLTLLKECIDYARQTSSNLFGDLGRIYDWDGYIKRASDCAEQLERYFGGKSAAEILFESEGLRGHFAESRKAREEVAATVGDGVEKSGECLMFENHGQDTRFKGPLGVAQPVTATFGMGGNNQPFVVHKSSYWDGGRISDCLDCSMLAKGQMMPEKRRFPAVVLADHTLDSLGNHAVCIQGSMIGRADKNGPQGDGINEEVSFTLNTIDRHAVASGYAVRRLTPLECLRLMGFPDYWLDIEGMSDTQKYRSIGNSVAIPCVKFVLGGIARVLGGEKK